jgi:hypothetical protein
MIKDIEFPEIKQVNLAVVNDSKQEEEDWNVYLINLSKEKITGVLITSKGYGKKGKETSTLRHFFEEVLPESYIKIEIIQPEVFGLNNEYWVSFFRGNKMYDKRYIFLPETIQEKNYTTIPVMNVKGILHP